MNLTSFKSIIDLLNTLPNEQACIDYLTYSRWNDTIISPFDAASRVYKCKNNRYRCKNTGKYFNCKTGTIFESSKIPLQKWLVALYLFSSHKKGISSHQLAKDISVTQKTAWFMLHRLRSTFSVPAFQKPLEGIVEADETFIGAASENMHKNKKKYNSDGNFISNKIPVLGLRSREGYVIAKVILNVKAEAIHPIIMKHVKPGSVLYTDNSAAYNFSAYYMSDHQRVNHSGKQYVIGTIHTNGIENFWSHLKRGISGVYHWASTKHLQSYVDEYTLRFNTRDMQTSERFIIILTNINKRLTYKKLVA